MIRVLTLFLIGSLVGFATAQADDDIPKWRIDPYTANEPKLLENLGYVSYAPIPFGQRGSQAVDSAAIDAALPYEKILWVETAHFRIGSSLEAFPVPFDPETKAKIRAELERLKERGGLAKVNPKTRRLDEWLRLHLIAQRMEDHYAVMQGLFGVTDDDFPLDDEDRATRMVYAGEGRYLGEKQKYMVLVFQTKTSFDGYVKAFIGRLTAGGQQWNFKEIDGLGYICSADNPHEEGRLRDDTALHGHLLHALTHLTLNGYMHYNYDLPVWMNEGLAHYFERQVSPRFNSFTRDEGAAMLNTKQWRWEKEARDMVVKDDFQTLSEIMNLRNYGQLEFDDHVALWSRWDYLMTLDRAQTAKFFKLSKTQIDSGTGQIASDILEGVRSAMKEAYGLSPLTLDERWKEWVIATYPAK